MIYQFLKVCTVSGINLKRSSVLGIIIGHLRINQIGHLGIFPDRTFGNFSNRTFGTFSYRTFWGLFTWGIWESSK